MAMFFALVILLVARLDQRAPVQALAGRAYVIDGDTISISGNHIRLKGIDAPELVQSCGTEAAMSACGQVSRQTLLRLISGREVRCEAYGRDKYNRSLAVCRVGETNINRAMIEAGQAVAYGDYQEEEGKAREARKGLWTSRFETPQDWRREHEEMPEQFQPQPDRPTYGLDQIFDWVRRLAGEFW